MNVVQGTKQVLVVGGETATPQQPSPILLFDEGTWSTPQLPKNDTAAFRRLFHASTSTGKDGAILHGGYQSSSANGTVVSTIVTLKVTNNFKPLVTAPVALAPGAPSLARHTMTLTTDGRAVILGGIDSQGVVANMTVAYVLDTQANSGEWIPTRLEGTPPDPRMSFTTVLVNATTMLVYGGTDDLKTGFSAPYYLDLPSWTWSSPPVQGVEPKRWGHTATMAGTTMIVGFGSPSSDDPGDTSSIAILDTTTNTWIKEYRPLGMAAPEPTTQSKGLSVGGVLGIFFVVTILLVGGIFHLLVRRRKRRTRNTLAKENMGNQSARTVVKRQASSESSGFLSFFGLGPKTPPSSKRYSEMPHYSNPMSVTSRMAQMGYTPVSLGYPETVVQHGCGQIPVSEYIYPNQACVETEKEQQDGQETAIVYHMLTQAQQEALKLSKQATSNKTKKLYQLDS
ncbi:hypothetical protein BGX31_000749 [Mortierella sp. GBA43]|nr:hypothetical protein BGX31_000749 [Mortierella sp. GBA43]